jgi:hypothetical protein
MFQDRIIQVTAAAAAALVLVASFSGGAAAAEVVNDSGEALVAQAIWGTADLETGAGEYGMLAASIQDGESMLFLYDQSEAAVVCDAGTPGDPSDDYSGLSGTFRTATGPADVQIAANLRTASASATLSIETFLVDACAPRWEVIAVEPAVDVSLDLSAVGGREGWIDKFDERLPGEFNSHAILRSASQPATGTLSISGEVARVELGLISRNRWNGHFNGG